MNLKTIILPIATILTGAITLLSGTVQAQEVPLLKQKMPYSEARAILINAGWQAIEIPIMQRGDRYFGAMEYIIKDLGYNEVVNCSGTGLGLCRFEFAAADGRKLIVSTASNNRRAEKPVVLYRWMVEKGEPQSSAPKPGLRAQNPSDKCTTALGNARRRIETGRAVQVVEITSRDISNYPDAPSGRPTHRYLLMKGAATTSVLNSGQFMKAIATDIIQSCNSTGMVTFALANSGNAVTYGIFPGGRVDGFECLEPGIGAKKPVWGEIYCT
ncbi:MULTISPECIES: hypothetical protein [Leptolyngbya]|uniref:hypothetical protein n=1 Tax=Leptolyngbya TaxID=47251 RepID=UPI001683BF3F|nr:hypothetical protein [Leptolyngbya sp. FACHB-1624]MBD1859973.1 hypothetical protein [Leptolyngbya sp. FACHB-1624]